MRKWNEQSKEVQKALNKFWNWEIEELTKLRNATPDEALAMPNVKNPYWDTIASLPDGKYLLVAINDAIEMYFYGRVLGDEME